MPQPRDYTDQTDPFYQQQIEPPRERKVEHRHRGGTWTISFLTSAAVAIGSAGSIWGLYSSRLANAENRVQATEARAALADRENSRQDIAIATLQAQFAEILRRLETIERKIDKGQR